MTRSLFAYPATLALLIASGLPLGCKSGGHSAPYAPLSELDRDTAAAERLTRQAADLIYANPEKAEALLREALTKDFYHGPAHNNLGVLFLARGEVYMAASEFECARKLMPGNPDPRFNLALTLERAGRVDDAIRSYSSALETCPEHIAAIQGLACLQVRFNRRDDRTDALLADIALRGDTEPWRQWAQREVIKAVHEPTGKPAD